MIDKLLLVYRLAIKDTLIIICCIMIAATVFRLCWYIDRLIRNGKVKKESEVEEDAQSNT